MPRRSQLLDRFLEDYTGPKGSERYLYNLDGPTDAVLRLARAVRDKTSIAVSADVGPDLLQPWRRPSLAIVYVRNLVDLHSAGLVESQGRHDANVVVRVPEDQSVFRSPPLSATLEGIDINLADESQLIWDLQDLGGTDRLEAAGKLREWLLNDP